MNKKYRIINIGSGILNINESNLHEVTQTGETTTTIEEPALIFSTIGNTSGIIKIGRNEISYGPIGANAIDLSNPINGVVGNGATGNNSMTWGTAIDVKNTLFPIIASGDFSTAWGLGTIASGDNSTAWGQESEANATMSTAWGLKTEASAQNATAWGSSTNALGQRSTAFGSNSTASGDQSTAWGNNATASSQSSTAWGSSTNATNQDSTAWGRQTQASGSQSTAWGTNCRALGTNSTAWGQDSDAFGTQCTAWGNGTNATSSYTTAWGQLTNATGQFATAWGQSTNATAQRSTAWGTNTNASNSYATAFGLTTVASGIYSTAWGFNTIASNDSSTAFGFNTTASGTQSTALGVSTQAIGISSTAWGDGTIASGHTSTAWGIDTRAFGDFSTTWGGNSIASANLSTAWGDTSTASGDNSTAWGNLSIASGLHSTTWGRQTQASGLQSTAWGNLSIASNNNSTAWGSGSIASGTTSTAWGSGTISGNFYSTAWGDNSRALGQRSTAWGFQTTAESYSQTSFGEFNTIASGSENTWVGNDRLLVVGNGQVSGTRSDALTILKKGDIIAPSLTTDIISSGDSKILITKEYADANYSGGTSGDNLGNHIVTQSLDINNEDIIGVSKIISDSTITFSADTINYFTDEVSPFITSFFQKQVESPLQTGTIANNYVSLERTGSPSGSTNTYYADLRQVKNTSNEDENGTTGFFLDVVKSGTMNSLWSYGSDIRSRFTGGGDVGFLNGQVVKVEVTGNEPSTVSTIMRGISPNVKVDNPNTSVQVVQGLHPTVELKKGTIGSSQIMFLDFDLSTSDPELIITGDLSYIEAGNDNMPLMTVGGKRRFIKYTGVEESDFGGIINVTSNVSNIENASEKVLVTKEWVTGFTANISTNKYSETIGDGSTTGFTINHNLNTEDISITIKNTSTGAIEDAEILITDNNNITVNFAVSPINNGYRITIISNSTSRFSETIGDGSATSYGVNHTLDSEDVSITIKNTSTGAIEDAEILIVDNDNITVNFAVAPINNGYRITIIK